MLWDKSILEGKVSPVPVIERCNKQYIIKCRRAVRKWLREMTMDTSIFFVVNLCFLFEKRRCFNVTCSICLDVCNHVLYFRVIIRHLHRHFFMCSHHHCFQPFTCLIISQFRIVLCVSNIHKPAFRLNASFLNLDKLFTARF